MTCLAVFCHRSTATKFGIAGMSTQTNDMKFFIRLVILR